MPELRLDRGDLDIHLEIQKSENLIQPFVRNRQQPTLCMRGVLYSARGMLRPKGRDISVALAEFFGVL